LTYVDKQCFTSGMERTRDSALDRAIQAAGGPAELARFITEHQEKISAQAICDWKRCPPARVLIVERASGTDGNGRPRVSRHELRPDLYPPEELEAAA
jgi:DNA-binding transcriptional regulator YdaS (Cro superfamily)